MWGDNQLFLCKALTDYLTTYVCLPNHYDLKVQRMNLQFSSDVPCD